MSSVIYVTITIIVFDILKVVKGKSNSQSKLRVEDSMGEPIPMREGIRVLVRIIARSILAGTWKHDTKKMLGQHDEFEDIS